MTRPLLLDLFCGAGGASVGYHRAGFDVVGVDIKPQPTYPFEFEQGDALHALNVMELPYPSLMAGMRNWNRYDFAAIHASPPCQFATQMNAARRARGVTTDRINYLTPTAAILRRLGVPYVIENVVGAKRFFSPTLQLHGGMFGLKVHRPRLFECSFAVLAPKAPINRKPVGVYGDRPDPNGRTRLNGGGRGTRSVMRIAKTLAEAQEAMDMPWADWKGCKEAIPPAYTEYIGKQLLAALEATS